MNKTAFIFPGQGAQYVGMGKDFYENIDSAKEIIDLASQVTGLDVPALCFEENEQIHITEYTQIAMVAVEIAMAKVLNEKGITSDVNAGLSLGEYSALAVSGAMSYEDVFRLVRQRGIFMQEAVPTGGAMSAVLGMDAEKIEAICADTEGIVSIANYNCPGQIVITGEQDAVNRAGENLKEAGAKRIVPLKVSGPFHSAMLLDAGKKLENEFENVTINDFSIPYLSNVTAEYVTDKKEVKDLLVRQISSSVRWQQCIEKMIENGVDTFIEIGPGKTLSGFMRKINRNVTCMNVEKLADLDAVLEKRG